MTINSWHGGARAQQAVLLWHSWCENVPSTWPEPRRELADGGDAGVCVLIFRRRLNPTPGERRQRRRGPAGAGEEASAKQRDRERERSSEEKGWERGERGHNLPRAHRCFTSLALIKQLCILNCPNS